MKRTTLYIVFALAFVCQSFCSFAQTKAAEYKLPGYEKFVLSNGLTVYLMEQHEVPVINVAAIVPAGAIYDGSQAGLASLTATALKHGTKNYTKTKLEEELDFVGATLATQATKEYASLSAGFAAKDQTKVLPLIKEVLVNPTFDAAEFEKEKKRMLTNLERAKESPRSVMGSYWSAFLYKDHVYANPVTGKVSTVGQLQVADVQKFYQANYIPNGSAIAIVGDFKAKDMKAQISKLFADWKKGTSAQKNLAASVVTAPTGNNVLLINKDDARETTFYIGGVGIKRDNPDYVAIEVVNTVFGGRFTSWLNDELRVNSGLTYGASSRFLPLKNAGTFYISTFTANKTTEPTIDKALEVLNRLHTTGIDETTLQSAKNYVKGQYLPDYETAGQLAGLLTEMFWYGFNESFINSFQANVDQLTTAKAKEIVAKYFPKDKLQFVLVGKAEEIKKIAEKYGPVTEKQIKADGF
ncbi:pitrilysin family protein [Xanthocytophaga agilis]|uniref:Pitrilysin family protein n=1 Tax=Xanthocytophaga agilis TaxID=3048010 RepID=A0AAE3QYZ2_9BACT|nr:pitrilysin family protein [Xanthocytophaga agilis]MDJ1500624.1 pitrilysin family protein [Xanthocytophaga agilis]